jgi:hypothetical protein
MLVLFFTNLKKCELSYPVLSTPSHHTHPDANTQQLPTNTLSTLI